MKLFGGSPVAETSGPNSPAINAGGNVNYVQGFTAEQVQGLVRSVVTDATASHAKEVADLAGQLGATKEAVVNFLRLMGEKQIGPDQLIETLSELGEKYRAANERLAGLIGSDGAVQALINQARAANDRGDYEEADRLLAEAEAPEFEIAKAAQARADATFARVAEIRASRGFVAAAGLRFAEAAALYGSALDAMPASHAKQRDVLKMLRAEALERHGTQSGENAALANAIAAYESIVGDAAADEAMKVDALVGLGRAQSTLGTREENQKRLFEAVTTFELASKYRPCEGDPKGWAMIQNAKGIALGQLGRRGGNLDVLKAAVAAYIAALEALGQDAEPARVVPILTNAGTALRLIGQRETGVENLEKALQADDMALARLDRATSPLSWATVQRNKGTVPGGSVRTPKQCRRPPGRGDVFPCSPGGTKARAGAHRLGRDGERARHRARASRGICRGPGVAAPGGRGVSPGARGADAGPRSASQRSGVNQSRQRAREARPAAERCDIDGRGDRGSHGRGHVDFPQGLSAPLGIEHVKPGNRPPVEGNARKEVRFCRRE